jgi:hypothetical protein
MASSASDERLPKAAWPPKLGYIAAKYYAGPHGQPDNAAIDRNIRTAVQYAVPFWQNGFAIFVPHLNTHHFQSFTSVEEPVYIAFDKRLLPAMDFLAGAGNVVDSTGGRGEIELMTRLGKPSFPSLRETLEWRAGRKHLTYRYEGMKPEPPFDEAAARLKIAVIDGPFWAESATAPDLKQIRDNIDAARHAAIELWNSGIACFTPQMNASYFESGGYRVPDAIYDFTIREILERAGDCLYLLPGWDSCPDVRARIDFASKLGKPIFDTKRSLLDWQAGGKPMITLRSV